MILHEQTPSYDDFNARMGVINIANQNQGKHKMEINENITFHLNSLFTKRNNGRTVFKYFFFHNPIEK